MTVRFLTSIGCATGSFVEGQSIDIPDPAPEPFLGWLRRGLIAVERRVSEVALAPAAVEQAIARRAPLTKAQRRRARATAAADGAP